MSWLTAVAVSFGLAAQPVPAHSAPLTPSATQTCLKTCSVGEDGYSLIRSFEGYMPFPYRDIAGIETVGYGYVIRKGDIFGYPLLPEQADQLLKITMREYEPAMNRVISVRLRQSQFDGLGSWSYNLGTGALRSSTLLKRVNAGRHTDVPGEMMKWDKAVVKGKLQVVPGLARRRAAEGALYSSAD